MVIYTGMNKKKLAAVLITILLLVFIFYKINWQVMLETFKNFNLKYLWAIVLLYVLTLYLRGIRWKALLLNNAKYSGIHLAQVFTVGSMLNIFLPARAGDLYRAYYLGSVKNEQKMKIFGSVILERTLDGVSVFLILLAAVLLYCKQEWIMHLACVVGTLFFGSLIFFYIVFKFDKIDCICEKLLRISHSGSVKSVIEKICAYAKSFMTGFEVLNNGKCFLLALCASFLIWGIEAYIAFLILSSFDMALGFAASLFVISLISFSTMIPSTSMFLGPYQIAYIAALGIFGVQKSSTIAVSTVHQLIITLILTIIGVYYLLKFNISIKEIKNSKRN